MQTYDASPIIMIFDARPFTASLFGAIRLQESLCLAVFHCFPLFFLRAPSIRGGHDPDPCPFVGKKKRKEEKEEEKEKDISIINGERSGGRKIGIEFPRRVR